VKDKETAYDVWNALRDKVDAKHTNARVNLITELHRLKYSPRLVTFQDFCLNFDRTVRELRQTGYVMEALDERVQFLMTMPEEYEAITRPLLRIAPSQEMQYVSDH